jgi:hypothetical protein
MQPWRCMGTVLFFAAEHFSELRFDSPHYFRESIRRLDGFDKSEVRGLLGFLQPVGRPKLLEPQGLLSGSLVSSCRGGLLFFPSRK